MSRSEPGKLRFKVGTIKEMEKEVKDFEDFISEELHDTDMNGLMHKWAVKSVARILAYYLSENDMLIIPVKTDPLTFEIDLDNEAFSGRMLGNFNLEYALETMVPEWIDYNYEKSPPDKKDEWLARARSVRDELCGYASLMDRVVKSIEGEI